MRQMYLVLSKRFEISLSYRLFQNEWSPQKNRDVFGPQVGGEHGFGGNFVAYFVFHGPVDASDGMLINVTIVKERIGRLLAERYDHKYLNADTKPFDTIVPTPENVACRLLADAQELFSDVKAQLVACHLVTAPFSAATAYAGGRVERDYWLEFSAARRTWSPHLSEAENQQLFGMAAAPSGHGHYYRLRATLRGDIDNQSGMIAPDRDCRQALLTLYNLLDHRNLNSDVPQLKDVPMTTEYLAKFLFGQLRETLPVNRVRLHENPYFFAEHLDDGQVLMAIETGFRAAHRLHSPCLADDQNTKVYGKCNNPHGHGHLYRVEATIAGKLDERSGTLFPLDRLQKGLSAALAPWDYKHLDLDTDDFADKPSTGENIVRTLWPRVEKALDHRLCRLRLWETPNNRFTLRRSVR